MKKLISALLAVCLLSFTACSSNISSTNLLANIKKDDISPIEIVEDEQNR